MGRKLHFKPGSFYRNDDRSGFPQRAERTKREWNGLIVDESLWEPRQPQDLVRGLPDKQTVPDARPLAPNVFVGPIETTLSANIPVLGNLAYVSSTYGMSIGDTLSIMMDNGVLFFIQIADVEAGLAVLASGLPYAAASGNVVYNYGAGAGGSVAAANDLATEFNIPIITENLIPLVVS